MLRLRIGVLLGRQRQAICRNLIDRRALRLRNAEPSRRERLIFLSKNRVTSAISLEPPIDLAITFRDPIIIQLSLAPIRLRHIGQRLPARCRSQRLRILVLHSQFITIARHFRLGDVLHPFYKERILR